MRRWGRSDVNLCALMSHQVLMVDEDPYPLQKPDRFHRQNLANNKKCLLAENTVGSDLCQFSVTDTRTLRRFFVSTRC